MVMEGVEWCDFFAYLFHCWCYNPVAIFYLCLFAHAYHVEFQMVNKFSYLEVTEVFLMHMEKLVCSNSNSNQEEIRKQ